MKKTTDKKITEARPLKAIIRPYVSEKSQRGIATNQYSFLIEPKATKSDVKNEVEHFYKVKVIGVTITTIRAKTKRYRTKISHFQNKKKATVRLMAGQSIDIA